jgi:alpha-tubulin suppressor-like RCC1 family protein
MPAAAAPPPPPQRTSTPTSAAGSDVDNTASTRRATSPHNHPPFAFQVKGSGRKQHSVGITVDGVIYTWGASSGFGQLGRPTGKTSGSVGNDSTSSGSSKSLHHENSRTPGPAAFSGTDETVRGYRAYVGGASDSGHTAVLDVAGNLWMTGCDRWQQLGLGSPAAGSAGYTWVGGKTHQTSFQKNAFITTLLQQHDATARIRDVALGGDHTVVLSSNQKDVFAFGKGAEGQLGLNEKRFVSAAARSSVLSAATDATAIASVCAMQNCSLTMDKNGRVLQTAGKCRETADFIKALATCRERAEKSGLQGKE